MDGRWTRRSALSATRTSSATSPWAGASPPSEPRSPATEGSAARAPQGAAAAPGLPLARLGDRRDEALGQAERRADALAELPGDLQHLPDAAETGRASCRESVCQYVSISVVAVALKKKKN